MKIYSTKWRAAGESITVVLEEGESVTIEPTPQLKPLPRLDGRVPEG